MPYSGMLFQMLFSPLLQAEPLHPLAAFHRKHLTKRGEEFSPLFAVGKILGCGDDVAFVVDQHDFVPFIGLLRKLLAYKM